MIKYILKKLFYGGLVLWGVVTLVFFLFQVMPGDPARGIPSQRDNPEQLQLLKHKYGFDKPIMHQYFYYLNDVSPISFHDENEDMDVFQWYSRVNCRFECSMSMIEKECGCRPWDFPNRAKTGQKPPRICDFFGSSCFNTFIFDPSATVYEMHKCTCIAAESFVSDNVSYIRKKRIHSQNCNIVF